MKLHPFTLLALCLVPACGGSSDPRVLMDEGSKALNSGDYSGAADSYEQALAALGSDTGSTDWKRAKIGWVQAMANLDAPKARDEFLAYAKASPSKVTDSDFNLVASRLGDAKKMKEATDVLTVGVEMFPESPHLDALGHDLAKRAKEGGDADALDALKGLGYGGGD